MCEQYSTTQTFFGWIVSGVPWPLWQALVWSLTSVTIRANLEVPDSNPGRTRYLLSWLGKCSAPYCSKAWSVQCVYATVHYKEPLKSFKIRVELSPGFRLPSVTILPQYAERRDFAIHIHIYYQSRR